MAKIVYVSKYPFTPQELKEISQRGWDICMNPSMEAIELFKKEMENDKVFACYYGFNGESPDYLMKMAKDAVRIIQYKQAVKR